MKLFATRVWGFDPSNWPVIVFNRQGLRDRLLRDAGPGDRIIFVATEGNEPKPEERGRILGMAEIGRTAVDTLQVVRPEVVSRHDRDERGNLRWPKAIPMLRAWRFPSQPLLRDVLTEQLSYFATIGAVLLKDEDTRVVQAFEAEEIQLPESEVLRRERAFSEALATARGPTKGPPPVDWDGTVSRSTSGDAYTYVFRYGSRDLWKVGWAVNVEERLADVNRHVPEEVTKECWVRALVNRHPNQKAAHNMEQRLLSLLSRNRTVGERVQCSEKELRSAWVNAFRG